ncbi:MAG TPA: glycosyl hydrolase family 9 [Pricia antarctica]|uniref:Glycosyl hydrolase family 9 n=3 Tax=root TaxID=1 RepID=A0A831QRL7_9FLAO|nr:glycosyl hydrolase family 9 [Pricia antarctica]
MNRLLLLVSLGCISNQIAAQNQISADPELEKDIIQSGIIHSPLQLNYLNSFEAKELNKKVLYNQLLVKTNTISNWSHSGYGKISLSKEKSTSDAGSLKMEFPTYTGKRAQGSKEDPDYATYGNCTATFDVNHENWEKYNRIAFKIFPDCEGSRVVNIDFIIKNGSSLTKSNYNRQSGNHLLNLKNHEWNTCFLDLGEYQRDSISQISFNVSLKGKDITTGDAVIYYIDTIELQQIENQEKVSGWMPGQNTVVYSTTGYMLDGEKTAIVNMDENYHKNRFWLIDPSNGNVAYSGPIRTDVTTTGTYAIADFSDFKIPGNYQLKVGDSSTAAFRIGKNIWENSLWKTLNFVFCQRCGYPVPGKHGTCHIDLMSEHNGKRISYGGGWHDAGDLSQQTLQTADVAYNFLEAYDKLKDKNPILSNRMLEEGKWGMDFILKNRYGDGYRASSMGLLIWQDGVFNSIDDISSVRVQDIGFDNFLYAAYEAYAAMTIPDDVEMREYLKRVAKADFEFALQKHTTVGYGEFHTFYEHSFNTSESQYMATASWAASMLFKLTNDPYYAEQAAKFIDYTLDCQRAEPIGKAGIQGFFYRDVSKKVIVHYNHQSREQLYMQSLILLCETQPNHENYSKWKKSIRLYGGYLKSLVPFTAPYGMLASGVYHKDEYKDSTSFDALHLFQPPNAREIFTKQVKNGIQLDDEHYLKRFPVWFSIFNGNTAVHLSMGKAAVICGKFLKDEKLLQIGQDQLYWVVGKNPFGQSLIYNEGYNYPQMDNFSSGETVGQIPVGIYSLANTDIPYWPQTNTSCYKEVWVTSAGKWISLASEF